MRKREIFTGKTVEDAVKNAAEEVQVSVGDLNYTVLDETKKGFLGRGGEATIQVEYDVDPERGAKEFLAQVLYDMGLEESDIQSSRNEEGDIALSVTGEHLGAIIGRHGEVMDALQYLASLVVNRGKGDFVRIILDIEGYREKRAAALESLAERMSERVAKTGRAVTLEPMNPYERRIIHAKVQEIDGVTTFSVGEGDDRKIVVAPEGMNPGDYKEERTSSPARRSNGRGGRDRDHRDHRDRAPRAREERSEVRKSTVDYAAIAASLPPREKSEVVKAKSIDELPLADLADTVDIVVDDHKN